MITHDKFNYFQNTGFIFSILNIFIKLYLVILKTKTHTYSVCVLAIFISYSLKKLIKIDTKYS